MGKRKREPRVEFEMADGYVILKYDNKEYAWTPPPDFLLKYILDDSTFMCTIVHNFNNQAMINIENVMDNELILRQEINPLKYKNIGDWVVDE